MTTLRLANDMANPSVVHPTQGINVSGIFSQHIVAWPSDNSPTKNHEDRSRGSPPPRGLNRKGVVKQVKSHVWLSHLLMSFLSSLHSSNRMRQVFSIGTVSAYSAKYSALLLAYKILEMFRY